MSKNVTKTQKKPVKRKQRKSDDEESDCNHYHKFNLPTFKDMPEENEAKSDKEEEEKIREKLAKSGLEDDDYPQKENDDDEGNYSTKKTKKRPSETKSRSKTPGTKKVKESDKKFSSSVKQEEDLEVKLAFEDDKDDDRSKVNPEEIEMPWFVKAEHVDFWFLYYLNG